MNVLQFTSSYPRFAGDLSGIFVHELSLRLSRFAKISILCPDSFETKTFEIIERIKIYRFRYFIKKYQKLFHRKSVSESLRENKFFYFFIPLVLIAEIISLHKTVLKEKIDIVHAHWIFPQGFIAVLVKCLFRLKYRVIISSHGSDVYGLKFNLLKRLARWSLSRADYVCAVSSSLEKEIRLKISPHKPVSILPMGVDSERFSKLNERIRGEDEEANPFILYVGRLTKEKGVEYLIRAMPGILKIKNNIKLYIIGFGDEEKRLRALASDLGLGKVVIFLGKLPNERLREYYSTAQMLIFPSLSEGLGLVLVEALLCGCPVIATKVGGIKDVIIDERTGLLVEPESPLQIVKAASRLLKDRELRQKLIENGLFHAKENFSWQSIGNKFMALYSKVLLDEKKTY